MNVEDALEGNEGQVTRSEQSRWDHGGQTLDADATIAMLATRGSVAAGGAETFSITEEMIATLAEERKQHPSLLACVPHLGRGKLLAFFESAGPCEGERLQKSKPRLIASLFIPGG